MEHARVGWVGWVRWGGWGPDAATPFLWASGMKVEPFDAGATVIFNTQFSSTDV